MDSFLHYGGKVKSEDAEDNGGHNFNIPDFNIPDSTIDENELLDFSSIDNAFGAQQQEQQEQQQRGQQGQQGQQSQQTQGEATGSLKTSGSLGAGQPASVSRNNSTSLQSKRIPSSSYSNSLNNSYISQSLSSSIPIKQSLAKALPTLSESYNSNTDNSNKVHKISTSRRKSSIKRDSTADDEGDDDTVERKRRDNMNDKIQELYTMIPEDFFEDSKDKSSGTKDGKPNKGQILTKGLEYIQNLQNKIDENNRKEVELILKLKNLSVSKNYAVNDINLNNTSAEIVLGEIGVGPLAGIVSNSTTVDNTTTISSTSQKSPNNNFEYGGYDQYGS